MCLGLLGRVLELTDERDHGQILPQQLWLAPLSWQVSIKNYCPAGRMPLLTLAHVPPSLHPYNALMPSSPWSSCRHTREITLYPCRCCHGPSGPVSFPLPLVQTATCRTLWSIDQCSCVHVRKRADHNHLLLFHRFRLVFDVICDCILQVERLQPCCLFGCMHTQCDIYPCVCVCVLSSCKVGSPLCPDVGF